MSFSLIDEIILAISWYIMDCMSRLLPWSDDYLKGHQPVLTPGIDGNTSGLSD